VPPARIVPSAISFSYLRLSIWGGDQPHGHLGCPDDSAMAAIIVQAAIVAGDAALKPSQW
jgi:hypothetical protein